MNVALSSDERDLILLALWRLKVADGNQRATTDDPAVDHLEMGLKVSSAIDKVAFKLGGQEDVVYGLGRPLE